MPFKTTPIPPMTRHSQDCFWSNVDASGDCWTWEGWIDKDGYGRYTLPKDPETKRARTAIAHRIAYTILLGGIPDGLTLDHLCTNKRCVNPDHMEPVTLAENIKRAHCGRRKPGSRPWAGGTPPWVTSGKNITGRCIKGHEYTEENTYYYKDGRTDCRTCRKANKAAYNAKLAAAKAALKPTPDRALATA